MFKKVVSLCLSVVVIFLMGAVVRAENADVQQQYCKRHCDKVSKTKKKLKELKEDVMNQEIQREKQENQREELVRKKNLMLQQLRGGNCSFFKKIRLKAVLFLLEKIEKLYDKIGITKESIEKLNRDIGNIEIRLDEMIFFANVYCYPEYPCLEDEGREL